MEAYLHRQIHDLLTKARAPVFVSDERIDGDSLGSALAMADFMASLGKTVPVYVVTTVPEQYRRLPRAHQCTTSLHMFDHPEIDLVVVFDCSDAEFVRGLVERIPGNPTVVNIDHHTTNSRYGQVNQVVEDEPATAAIVLAAGNVADFDGFIGLATVVLAAISISMGRNMRRGARDSEAKIAIMEKS